MNVRLKDVVTTNARVLPETTDSGFTFRYVDISAVTQGHIEVPQEDMRFGTAPSRARRLASPGDTVVSTVRTYLRAVARVPETEEPLVFSTGFAVLHPKRHVIDGRYLSYYCTSAPFVESVVARSVGVSYPAINASEVADVRLDLPPLDEQRRIADFLDTETTRLDSLVARRETQRSLLGDRRASLLIELVGHTDEGPVARSGLPWLPTIPSHWPVVKLTLLARLGSGHTPSRSHPEWWVDAAIPWITTGEVAQLRDDRVEELTETREMISELGIANSAAEVHPRGTVVLSRTASVGYSAVMGADMATSQDFATWTCGPRLDPYYLLWTLRAMRPWLLGARAMGSTHKTIYMPDIQALRVPVPPLAEQRAIVARVRSQLSALDTIRDALDDQVGLLRERRQALITAAVTGQLDATTAQRATVGP